MSFDTWLKLTPAQFYKAYEDYQESEREKFEAEDLSRWRIARWQVWRTLCPPDKKSISQFDLITLPGDEAIKEYHKQQKHEHKNKPKNPRDEARFRALVERWK